MFVFFSCLKDDFQKPDHQKRFYDFIKNRLQINFQDLYPNKISSGGDHKNDRNMFIAVGIEINSNHGGTQWWWIRIWYYDHFFVPEGWFPKSAMRARAAPPHLDWKCRSPPCKVEQYDVSQDPCTHYDDTSVSRSFYVTISKYFLLVRQIFRNRYIKWSRYGSVLVMGTRILANSILFNFAWWGSAFSVEMGPPVLS